jgi:glycosyltransferase involved in cell wall biosynthesis
MRVAYVLGTFPKLSETFILREVQELERQGVEVALFALERSADPLDADVAGYASRTVYRAAGGIRGRGTREACCSAKGLVRCSRHAWRVVGGTFPDVFRAAKCLRAVSTSRRFAIQAENAGIERVHAHFAGMPALLGLVMADLLGVPFSFSAHANDVFVRPELLDWKAASADLILTCNRAAHEVLQERVAPADRPKVHLIHHGLPLQDYPFAPELPVSGPPLIVSVGRLEEKKGYPDLLHALKLLVAENIDLKMEVFGDGAERKALERLSGELGLASRVGFRGARPHSEVMERLRDARIFALASKPTPAGDRDGIPNVLLEAAALGVPIVTTSAGSIPEFIGHERNGLLSPPGQPHELAANLRRALADGELCERLRLQARKDVEDGFDLRRNVAAIQALFEAAARRE